MKTKILRAHFVTDSWKNGLNQEYMHLDRIHFGWERKDEMIVPLWYEGSNLPSDGEYYKHINANLMNVDLFISKPNTSESESESDLAEENPLSDCNLS